jgi:hypothetical protein
MAHTLAYVQGAWTAEEKEETDLKALYRDTK